MTKKRLRFALLVGDGIGTDFSDALCRVMAGIPTIAFDMVRIDYFRLPSGDFDPRVIDIIKNAGGVAMKGPTRTLEGKGARSANVVLRQMLDLYANVRPIKHFAGVKTPMLHPEQLDVVIFRQNTEDIYMGIEAEAGSDKSKALMAFLQKEWGIDPAQLSNLEETGVGIKLISKKESERVMDAALAYAIKNNRKRIGIAHKGNIMKYTEGAFMEWCLAYAKEHYREFVYFKDEVATFSDEEKAKRIFIDIVTADDAFQQLLIKPKRFDLIVTPNLNGDYLSDAAAGQVGGVPLAAGGNIGDTYAVFEAIGGTADDIAGKDIANPTAFLLAFAMLLDHQGFAAEAEAVRDAIKSAFKDGLGTADMQFAEKLSASTFAKIIAQRVQEALVVETV